MADQIQEWVVDEPYLHIPCKLGEGPHYHAASNTLRFLDINSSKLHLIDLSVGPSSLRTIDTTIPIGVTADIAGVDPSMTFLAGAKDGVTKFHLPDSHGQSGGTEGKGTHEYLVKYWDNLPEGKGEASQSEKTRRFRANDGNVDTKGRFWVEFFEDPEISDPGPEGVLWRMDTHGSDAKLTQIMDKMTIPNGISWPHDGKTMYITDSPVQRVYRFPYNAETGEVNVSDRDSKIWYHLDEEGVFPDGHAMDVEGNLWHACYGGGKVIRISPTGKDGEKGKVTGVVRLPTKNITCPVFVGTELFITSARDRSEEGSSGEEGDRSRKFGGSLFRVDVGVRGVEKREVQLG